MKIKDAIENGTLILMHLSEEHNSYEPAYDVGIYYSDEKVTKVNMFHNGTAYVITIQGREHIGEYYFAANEIDHVELEVYELQG